MASSAASARLYKRLRTIHLEAGKPSLRSLAMAMGCSHTLVGDALAGRQIPRWAKLALLVELLNGDVGEFRELWMDVQNSPTITFTSASHLNLYSDLYDQIDGLRAKLGLEPCERPGDLK